MMHHEAITLRHLEPPARTPGTWTRLALAAATLSSLGWAGGCAGDDGAVQLRALVDGRRPPDLRGGADATGSDTVGPCATAADCAGHAVARCRVPVCLPGGTCGAAIADEGVACDDGNVCTGEDRCVAGECAGSGTIVGGPCDDGDACTVADHCVQGACAGGGRQACDDGDPCTEDACAPAVGCVTTVRACPDPPGDPCSKGVCDSADGTCTTGPRAEGEACDDGLGCTVAASCHDGACVGVVGPQCDDDSVCTVDFCTALGCSHSAVPGACDDGDPCTVSDACALGACVGQPILCDDNDPCTADTCVVGQCRSDPVPDCVPPTAGCDDKAVGQACDDADPATLADLCAGGVCRGFSASRVAAASPNEGQRFVRANFAGGVWTVVSALLAAADGAASELVAVGSDGVVTSFAGTRQASAFVDVHGGFAVDATSVLWTLSAGAWSASGPFAAALADSGEGRPEAVWSYRSPAGDVRVWIVGESLLGGPWARRCAVLAAAPGVVACNAQSVIGGEDPVMRAVTGTTVCGATTCTASLVAAADLFESTGSDGVPRYFNDVYRHNGTAGAAWQVASFDPGQSRMTSNDVTGLSAGRFLVVGGYGYLRTNAPEGIWGGMATIVEAQDQHHFEGAWSGDGVVVVAGWRRLAGVAPIHQLELLVAASDADLTDPTVWHRHLLGTESGDEVGLFDVWGHEGAWLVVGAGRGEGAAASVEGLVFRR